VPVFVVTHNEQDGPVMLDDPTVIEGHRVTHLRYRVSR